jgi:thioredoxin 1
MAKQFTDDNFQAEVIEASKAQPVLVDFFASWCGPCKMIAPIIEELAEDMEGKAVIGKLDTEAAGKTAAAYNVMSIPTLIIFKDGEAKETLMGAQPKESLAEALNKYL